MNIIKVNNLSYKYNKKGPDILSNLTFSVEKGTINVILGLNGCGKSTLIKLLVGLLKSNSNSILINNKPIESYSKKSKAKVISYVAQINNKIDEYNVMNYLLCSFANYSTFYSSPTKEQKNKIMKILNDLGISHLINKTLGQLSGGERQMISICSAYLQDAEIIILDEPTSALDLPNQARVLNFLSSIVKTGKTIILSTHNPNHALILSSNVFLFKDGVIFKSGIAKEIITKDILSNVFGKDVKSSSELSYPIICI